MRVDLDRSTPSGGSLSSVSLGLSLAGHRDRQVMAVFICGLNPNGIAYKDGRLQVGDELVEVNGSVLHGRCHLNASAIIKSIGGAMVTIIALRFIQFIFLYVTRHHNCYRNSFVLSFVPSPSLSLFNGQHIFIYCAQTRRSSSRCCRSSHYPVPHYARRADTRRALRSLQEPTRHHSQKGIYT